MRRRQETDGGTHTRLVRRPGTTRKLRVCSFLRCYLLSYLVSTYPPFMVIVVTAPPLISPARVVSRSGCGYL